MHFYKYEGTGNDFILFDNEACRLPHEHQAFYRRLCDRKLGIGADGLILLEQDAETAFAMRYYNADGREGSLCGNGARCAVHLAKMLDRLPASSFTFRAADGVHSGVCDEKGVRVRLHAPTQISEVSPNVWFLDTGSPHVVVFMKEGLTEMDVAAAGAQLRHDPQFAPGGTNVNFVQAAGDVLHIRTFERGVEAETLSCGTGAVAAALAALRAGILSQTSVKLQTRGGDLTVTPEVDGVWLAGPVRRVFEGRLTAGWR